MREIQRMAGYLKRSFGDLVLKSVRDPRKRKDTRWRKPESILKGVLVALLGGARSLKDVERRSSAFSKGTRRLTGTHRRIPDTTIRDFLLRVSVDDLRAVLRRQCLAAFRRKALPPEEKLPFHAVSMDGKWVTVENLTDPWVQRRTDKKTHRAYGLLRTITCALVSARACPCLDAIPVPGNTNEVGFFRKAFSALLTGFSNHFQVVMYDAGGDAEPNAQAVVQAGKDYIFRMKDARRQRHQLAKLLIEDKPVLFATEDVLDNRTTVRRALRLASVSPGAKDRKEDIVWSTTKTFLCVKASRHKDGVCVEAHDFYYDTSLAADALIPAQWLWLLRRRWGVENDVHGALDVAFQEDNHLGIVSEPEGTLALMMLRRIALNLLALFRKVTLRGENQRVMPYKALFDWVLRMSYALTREQVEILRPRKEESFATTL